MQLDISDLSHSLPLIKSIANEENIANTVAECRGLQRWGDGFWYSPIAQLCSVASNFLLVANYELASILLHPPNPPFPSVPYFQSSLTGLPHTQEMRFECCPSGTLLCVNRGDWQRRTDIVARCAMLANTIKNTDNNKKTSGLPIVYITIHYCGGHNAERLRCILNLFFSLYKKRKIFENVVSFLLRLSGENVWKKLLNSAE